MSTKPQPVEIRLPYQHYETAGLTCPEPSRTKQSFAEECDFNNVMNKWAQSGLIPNLNTREPIYADVSHMTDYHSSLELIRSAQEQFYSLPSHLRDRFNNDPAQLLAFIQNDANYDEAIKLGLVPQRKPVVDEAPITQGSQASSSTTATEGS